MYMKVWIIIIIFFMVLEERRNEMIDFFYGFCYNNILYFD